MHIKHCCVTEIYIYNINEIKIVKKNNIFVSKKFVNLKILFTFATVNKKSIAIIIKRRINRIFDIGKEGRIIE